MISDLTGKLCHGEYPIYRWRSIRAVCLLLAGGAVSAGAQVILLRPLIREEVD